jgi:hypothetical protein
LGRAKTLISAKTVLNGLLWRNTDHNGKILFVNGMEYGAESATDLRLAGTLPACPARVDAKKWFAPDADEVVKEVDALYLNATNLPLPMSGAVAYALMKLNGATKQQLDYYRALLLRAFVN